MMQVSQQPPALGQQKSRPSFEREFFQDNSSSSDDDGQNASDSSDMESEEEAKHF